MRSGTSLSSNSGELERKDVLVRATKEERSRRRNAGKDCNQQDVQRREIGPEERGRDLPARVCATVVVKSGEDEARRLRSQREVIRDVMLAAADCDTWLTLGELRALTRYGEAAISAQLRHLRKLQNGGCDGGRQWAWGAVGPWDPAGGGGVCACGEPPHPTYQAAGEP